MCQKEKQSTTTSKISTNLSITEEIHRQKKKSVRYRRLDNTIYQFDMINNYGTFYLTRPDSICCLFNYTWNIYQDRSCAGILSLNKFIQIQLVQIILETNNNIKSIITYLANFQIFENPPVTYFPESCGSKKLQSYLNWLKVKTQPTKDWRVQLKQYLEIL